MSADNTDTATDGAGGFDSGGVAFGIVTAPSGVYATTSVPGGSVTASITETIANTPFAGDPAIGAPATAVAYLQFSATPADTLGTYPAPAFWLPSPSASVGYYEAQYQNGAWTTLGGAIPVIGQFVSPATVEQEITIGPSAPLELALYATTVTAPGAVAVSHDR
jgi:hypothetical protein